MRGQNGSAVVFVAYKCFQLLCELRDNEYENVLERMSVIPEKSYAPELCPCAFTCVLVVGAVCVLSVSPMGIPDRFFYRIKKYSKLLPHGPSTCRDIAQNSDFIMISPTHPGNTPKIQGFCIDFRSSS